ncbi:hypothetical protein D9M68_900090 [compost metagenome]
MAIPSTWPPSVLFLGSDASKPVAVKVTTLASSSVAVMSWNPEHTNSESSQAAQTSSSVGMITSVVPLARMMSSTLTALPSASR